MSDEQDESATALARYGCDRPLDHQIFAARFQTVSGLESLGLLMGVVMMVVVVMRDSSKNRSGKHRQEERSKEDLLHGPNLA